MRPSELARLTHVSTDTLRVYERRGVLPVAHRSGNGYREYPQEAVARVRVVRRALAIGFTLHELRQVFTVRDRGGVPCHEVRAMAERKATELDTRIEELVDARQRLGRVIDHWDRILQRTPQGARAQLLEALRELVEPSGMSALVPKALRKGRSSAADRSRSANEASALPENQARLLTARGERLAPARQSQAKRSPTRG